MIKLHVRKPNRKEGFLWHCPRHIPRTAFKNYKEVSQNDEKEYHKGAFIAYSYIFYILE